MKKKKFGLRSIIFSIIWTLISLGGVLAAVQALGATSTEGIMTTAKEKANYYVQCIPAGECGIASIIKNWGNEGAPNVSPGNPSNPSQPGTNPIIPGIDPSNPGANPSKPEVNPSNPANPSNPGQPALEGSVAITRETKGYRGPGFGEPYVNNVGLVAREYTMDLLSKLKVSGSEEIEYNRAEWKHWSNVEGKACWNTREEILHRDAEEGTVVYLDKKMNVTENYDEACAIGRPIEEKGKLRVDTKNSGEWVDPYSGKSITTSSDLDIDHIVPLKYAAENGGQSWDEDMKEQFANDPDNLLATSAKENRSKGAKGPSGYIPPYKGYRCQYAKSFTGVASKYGLSITEKDSKALDKILSDCQI